MDLKDMDVLAKAECMDCKKMDSVEIKAADWHAYIKDNVLVQKMWPDLGTWDREVIIGCRTGFYQCALCNALLESTAEEA